MAIEFPNPTAVEIAVMLGAERADAIEYFGVSPDGGDAAELTRHLEGHILADIDGNNKVPVYDMELMRLRDFTLKPVVGRLLEEMNLSYHRQWVPASMGADPDNYRAHAVKVLRAIDLYEPDIVDWDEVSMRYPDAGRIQFNLALDSAHDPSWIAKLCSWRAAEVAVARANPVITDFAAMGAE